MLGAFFDTTTEKGLVFLYQEGQVLSESFLPEGLNGSATAVLTLQNLLKDSGLSVEQLTEVGFATGPGSYTGIRVGAAIAYSLAWARDLPLYGVSTLQGFIAEEESPFYAVIDAKVSGLYCLKGERKGAGVTFIEEPCVISCEEFVKNTPKGSTLVTPRATRLRSVLGSDFQWIEAYPSSSAYLEAVNKAEKHDKKLLYLRKTQAEIELEKKGC